jgi:hypothetical protein
LEPFLGTFFDGLIFVLCSVCLVPFQPSTIKVLHVPLW